MKSLPGVAIMPPDAVAPGCPPLSRARPACDLTATFEESELLRDAGLPQHRIRGVPREDLLVYGKTPQSDWAIPDLMVSAAGPVKVTTVSAENLLHPWRPSRCQDVTLFVLVPHMEFRYRASGDAVQFEQLGDEDPQLPREIIG